MNSDHVKGWRNYLTRQMQAGGMEENEAQEIAARWLESVEVRAAAVVSGSPEERTGVGEGLGRAASPDAEAVPGR